MANQRYFIFLSYSGKGYNGWQVQPGKKTIQGSLEDAISTLLQEEIKCTGAGRTDTGVHARMFVAHFDSARKDLHSRQNILFRLNSLLPSEIAVSAIVPVKDSAHARFDAILRVYEYTITPVKNPFLSAFSLLRHGDLDIDAMNRACGFMMEYSDFTSFSKLHTDAKTNICKISAAEWRREEDLFIFRIEADRFLRNMVRAIVGTMLEIGSHKIEPDQIRTIIEAKDRLKAGRSAKAEGLSLVKIEYPFSLIIKD